MIDRRNTGKRCRALRLIDTIKGSMLPGSMGTISYQDVNLGRELVFASWDEYPEHKMPVLKEDVEILEKEGNRC